MAIAFAEERKKQKKLTYVLIAIALIILIVLGYGFLGKPRSGEVGGVLPSGSFIKPEINFEVLESPALKLLQPFNGILPFEGEIGRINPFLPY